MDRNLWNNTLNAAGGIFGPQLQDLDEITEEVTPNGVALRYVVQGPRSKLLGREVELRLDYAELEAMRNGCSPAEVFTGSFMSWCPAASKWTRSADGAAWSNAAFDVSVPEVEVRVWLAEAAERGYWDGELRVGALCAWRKLDDRLAGAVGEMKRLAERAKDALSEAFVDARGGRGPHVKPRQGGPTLGARLIGWLTGIGDDDDEAEDRPQSPKPQAEFDARVFAALADTYMNCQTPTAWRDEGEMRRLFSDAMGVLGLLRLRTAVRQLRADGGKVTGNSAYDETFWRVAREVLGDLTVN
jgi:hypothetical protein